MADPGEGLALTGALAIGLPLLAYRQWRRQGLPTRQAMIHAGRLFTVILLVAGTHTVGLYLLGLDRLSIGSYALAALLCVAAYAMMTLLSRRKSDRP